MTTVTVNVDEQLLARAEQLARARNMSVAEMLERMLRVMTQAPLKKDELAPITRSLAGIVPPMSDEQVDAVIDEHRMRKYGR